MTINQNCAETHFDSHCFTFKTLARHTNPSKEQSIFALRYQVYCLERGFLPSSDYPDGLETDEYDDYSTYISATDQANIMVGALRVVRLPNGIDFPFQKHCTHLYGVPLPPNRDCVEVSRVVISKVYRHRADDSPLGISSKLLENPNNIVVVTDNQNYPYQRKQHPEILLGMLRQAYQYCKEIGVSYWYVATESSLARLLNRINFSFEAIGDEDDYYGLVKPYILAINKFESDLYRNNPALYHWFQIPLNEQEGEHYDDHCN